MNKPPIIVLIGLAATGKDTIAARLQSDHGFHVAVSYTTRQPRAGEVDGVHYHFISEYEFVRRLGAGEMYEYTVRPTSAGDLYYGAGKQSISDTVPTVIILDEQGVRQMQDSDLSSRLQIYNIRTDFKDRVMRYINRESPLTDTAKIALVDRILSDEQDELAGAHDFEKATVFYNNSTDSLDIIVGVLARISTKYKNKDRRK